MSLENRIKYQTLAVLFFLIAGSGYFLFYNVGDYIDSRLHDKLEYKKEIEKKKFNLILQDILELYSKRIDRMLSDETLIDAFALRQRELVYEKTVQQFKQFQKESKYIKIFSFRLPDGSAFLRVHKPEMYGDALNKKRKIIIDTNKQKIRNFGFEIGKLKMTYRIVTPIFKGDKYLGLVEFGIEPEVFMQKLSAGSNLNYALVVKKEMQDVMLKKVESVSKDNFALINGNEFFKNIFQTLSIKDHTFININNRDYVIEANLVLTDHKGDVQAYFITADDITDDVIEAKKLKQVLIIMMVLTVLLVMLLLNFSINFYIKSIKNILFTDELTGLKNRNALLKKLKTTTDTSEMILVDINSFKTVNELYGIDNGNDILKQMSKVVDKIAKYQNMEAFRVSSDEFVLFSYGSKKLLTLDILQEVYITIKKESFIVKDLNMLIDIDITIGGISGKDITLEKLDMALKAARKQRTEFVLYSENLDTRQDTRKIFQVKREIKNALENNNVVPYYQPIVDKEGNIIKYEALMRIIKLDSGKKEVISPFHFLDLSYKFNLYHKLSRAIIKQCFEVVKTTDKIISVNLSPSDIFDSVMSSYVLDELKNCPKANQIVVEITENESIKDFSTVIDFLKKVKKSGAKIAIDDFGSGYANYSNVFELKPDYIKIDGSLIKDIITNKENQIFVKAIVSMSKELGIKTIAEFVHSKEVYELAKSYGIDEFQGYYFGQPQENMQTEIK